MINKITKRTYHAVECRRQVQYYIAMRRSRRRRSRRRRSRRRRRKKMSP